jgi:hypothetical protein
MEVQKNIKNEKPLNSKERRVRMCNDLQTAFGINYGYKMFNSVSDTVMDAKRFLREFNARNG